jgi:hypothetical protein
VTSGRESSLYLGDVLQDFPVALLTSGSAPAA